MIQIRDTLAKMATAPTAMNTADAVSQAASQTLVAHPRSLLTAVVVRLTFIVAKSVISLRTLIRP